MERTRDEDVEALLKEMLRELELPDGAYDRAVRRYKDLGDWLNRSESASAQFAPHVYAQGSFRLGTAIRAGEYDVDLSCRLEDGLSPRTHTQKQVRDLVRADLVAYCAARGIEHPPEDKPRCLRLRYKDKLSFHLDAVPAIPHLDSGILMSGLRKYGHAQEFAASLAEHACLITDIGSPFFNLLSSDWPQSNPEGYATWFESRMRLERRLDERVLLSKTAQVDPIPTYHWESPLQGSVKLLKSHRDEMFKDDEESKPISIILTTLSALAYSGEATVREALAGILQRMDSYVGQERPLVANPVNPAEDFADKWYSPQHAEFELRDNFFDWLDQARADFRRLLSSEDPTTLVKTASAFGVPLLESQVPGRTQSPRVSVPRSVEVSRPPRPWQSR